MAEPASETLFDALVRVGDHFIDCFTIVERESPRRCLYVNDAFTRSTGYTPDEVVGKNLGFLQGPDDQQIVDAMRDSLNRNLAFCGDIVNYRKDGSEFMNRLVLLPIVQDDVGYYLGFQNVVDEATVGAADISQGEINHMMNNPLSALLLSVELAIAEGKDVDKAIHECAEIFRRINTFCRHLDEPHLFSDYNPFRGESVDPG